MNEPEWLTPPPCTEDDQGYHFWAPDGPDFVTCDKCGLDANILIDSRDLE